LDIVGSKAPLSYRGNNNGISNYQGYNKGLINDHKQEEKHKLHKKNHKSHKKSHKKSHSRSHKLGYIENKPGYKAADNINNFV
jgi:hypothetical protein